MSGERRKVGRVACPLCSTQIAVYANEAGTVSIRCHECELSAFAKRGTEAARKLAPAAPAPPAKGAKQPALSAPAPSPPAAKGFALSQL